MILNCYAIVAQNAIFLRYCQVTPSGAFMLFPGFQAHSSEHASLLPKADSTHSYTSVSCKVSQDYPRNTGCCSTSGLSLIQNNSEWSAVRLSHYELGVLVSTFLNQPPCTDICYSFLKIDDRSTESATVITRRRRLPACGLFQLPSFESSSTPLAYQSPSDRKLKHLHSKVKWYYTDSIVSKLVSVYV